METEPVAWVSLRDRTITLGVDNAEARRLLPLHLYFGPKLFTQAKNQFSLSAFQLLLGAKLEHEIDHLHRYYGTSLGLLLCSVFRQQTDLFFQEIDAAVGILPLPFPTETSCMRKIMAGRELERVLFAPTLRSGRCSSQIFAETLPFLHLDSVDAASETFGSLGEIETAPHANVSFPHRESVMPLGAASLFEFLGISRECGLRKKFGIRYSDSDSMIQTTVYQHAAQVFRSYFPDSGHRSSLPSDHYLACDLALWIPIGPNGVSLHQRAKKLRWEDIHPGHRFLRILELLNPKYFVGADHPLNDDYDAWFTEETSRICNLLDWPTPAQLAAEWLEAIEQPEHANIFVKDSPVLARVTRELLQRRRNCPSKAAHGYLSAENDQDLWFGQVALLEAGRRTTLAVDDGQEEWKSLGYNVPPAMALATALELLVFKRPETCMGQELLARYRADIGHVTKDINIYGQRHYNVKIATGRD